MICKSATLAATTLVLSANASASIISHRNLISDDTTNFITDTVTGRTYTRLGVT